MAEPTIGEAQRLLMRMHSAGTTRRIDLLHEALVIAWRVGHLDGYREKCGTLEG